MLRRVRNNVTLFSSVFSFIRGSHLLNYAACSQLALELGHPFHSKVTGERFTGLLRDTQGSGFSCLGPL